MTAAVEAQGGTAGRTATRRDPRYDILFEPIRIGPKVMKNRFYQVPQCTGAGHPRPGSNAGHRAVKAEGGWGGICTESCSIHPEVNQSTTTNATIWDEGDVINHRHMVDEVHKYGCLAAVELGAGGVKDNMWSRYVAPAFDRFPSSGTHKVYTYPATEDDIQRVLQMYEDAARRARDAGFDILYIHGAAGVFPVHALSRHFNRRKDGWGGSFEGRARLWVEALDNSSGADQSRRARVSDGVTSIIVTPNDLAAAWALDEGGRPLYPTVGGGEDQREMAFRTGINIVMHALTGNYKADQVHVPALLERLGQ